MLFGKGNYCVLIISDILIVNCLNWPSVINDKIFAKHNLNRMDKFFTSPTTLGVLTILGIVVSAAVGLAPLELREFFGIENMTFTKVVVGSVYTFICVWLWAYAISPLIPTKSQEFLIQAPDKNCQLPHR